MNKLTSYENLPPFSKIIRKPKSDKQSSRKLKPNRSVIRNAKRNQA